MSNTINKWTSGEILTLMLLFSSNTLKFNKEKVNITLHKYMGKTHLLYTWEKKIGVAASHIFECPVRFQNGLVLEWCDVEIPGVENHYTKRSAIRKIEILDSVWFNKLLNDFEKLY